MTTRTLNARIGLCLTLGFLAWSAGLPSFHSFHWFHAANAAEPKRLGVTTFRGPGEGVTRNVVAEAGKANHFQIVGGQQISKTASKLGVTLDTNDAFRAVAKELGIAAFVTGEVTVKKATLTVRNGSDGSVSAEATWSGPNPKKVASVVEKTFWRRLGSAIERAKAPGGSKQAAVAEEAPAPEPASDAGGGDDDEGKPKGKGKGKKAVAEASEDSEGSTPAESVPKKKKNKKKKVSDEGDAGGDETQVSAKAETEDEESGEKPEALDASVGLRLMTRSLTYVQDIYNRNSRYNLPLAPLTAFVADFYPAALFTDGFAANVGLTAEVAYLLPVVSTPSASGTGTYGTYSLAWAIGAKVRLPMGLFASVAYGDQRYQLTPSGGATGIDVPMTEYKFVRGGVGIKYKPTSDLSLVANVGYLQCLSLGQIGTAAYFPKGKGAAFEAGLAGGYRISPMLEVRVGVDIRRYGLAFHQSPTDPALANAMTNGSIKIAGGAVDQYLAGWGALAVLLGGDSSGSGAGSSHRGDDDDAPAAKSSKEKDDDGDKGDEKEKE